MAAIAAGKDCHQAAMGPEGAKCKTLKGKDGRTRMAGATKRTPRCGRQTNHKV